MLLVVGILLTLVLLLRLHRCTTAVVGRAGVVIPAAELKVVPPWIVGVATRSSCHALGLLIKLELLVLRGGIGSTIVVVLSFLH